MLTDQYLILFGQILSDARYSTIKKDTPEVDHLIDVLKMNMNSMIIHTTEDSFRMHKTRDYNAFAASLKEAGKSMESCHGGRVPSTPSSMAHPTTTTFAPHTSQPQLLFSQFPPVSWNPVAGVPTSTSGDRRDTTGVIYGGQGQPMDLTRA